MTENNASNTPYKEATVHDYLVFQPYPFEIGQKLLIESGPRRGDWEVIGLSDRKIRLRCPFSGREVEWDRFCYLVEERTNSWPHPD